MDINAAGGSMSFVAKYVDTKEYNEICSRPIQKFGRPYVPSRWAVDVQDKAFICNYDFDRETDRWSYAFWWRDSYFIFDIERAESATPANGSAVRHVRRFVSLIHLPAQMGEAEVVRHKLQEALVAYESFPFGPIELFFENWKVVT